MIKHVYNGIAFSESMPTTPDTLSTATCHLRSNKIDVYKVELDVDWVDPQKCTMKQ